jgi:hypothetical protein
MLKFQGAPEQDKKLVLIDVGHTPPMNDVIRETLDWLERYLGPVARSKLAACAVAQGQADGFPRAVPSLAFAFVPSSARRLSAVTR